MSAMQRNKGKAGEREAAAIIRDLTGWDVQRRVRQHDGDSDLLGVPGWCVEVKRHAGAGKGQIAAWWRQSVAQATQVAASANDGKSNDCIPLLLYRLDRQGWRAMWPLAVLLVDQRADYWTGAEYAADTTVEAWAAVAREIVGNVRANLTKGAADEA